MVADAGDADGGVDADSGTPADAGFVLVGEVALSASEIDFGPVVLSSTASQTLVITNPQDNAVRVSLAEPAGPDAASFIATLDVAQEGNAFTLEPGAQATLTLTFSPDEERNYLATLALDSCQGQCPSSIVVQAQGVLTGVQCPQMADVGLANPNTCIDSVVSCDNQGNATERVSAVQLDSADPAFTVAAVSTPVTMNPGDSIDLTITFCPTELGNPSADLQVITDQPSAVTRTISITGTAGGPDIECSPTAVDFGPAGLGSDLRRTVDCLNRGSDPLELMGALSAGADFSIVSGPTSPIAAGATGSFEISFTPSALGASQDTLQLTSNDPDTPSLSIMISGEAVDLLPCAIDAQPGDIDFGTVSPGDSRSSSFVFSNVGVTECVVTGFTATQNSGSDISLDTPTALVSLAPGDALTLNLSFAPQSPGVATSSVTLSFSNPSSPDLSVSVRGEGGTPELSASPVSVNFGSVALGCAEAEIQTVTIRRTAPGNGTITAVELIQSGTVAFSLNAGPLPQTLGFLETLNVDVSFTPPTTGAFAAQLRIVSNGTGPIVVPISGRGETSAQRTDTVNLSRPPVDVLFVVDDSCSMGAAQAALGASMPAFVNAFSNRGVDFQIGVVTTDMTDTTKAGRLQGMPTFFTPSSPDLLTDLTARMQPGISGSGTEQGIRASLAATTPPLANTTNAGFLRANADLAIVYLSDENDFSQGGLTTPDYLNGLRGAAGTGTLLLAGIVGPTQGQCNGPYGNAGAATRYAALIDSTTNGLRLSYCDDMLSNLLTVSGALFGEDVVRLSATPAINTLQVSVNGVVVPQMGANGNTWAYDRANNAIVFVDTSVVPAGASISVTYDAFCLSGSCGDTTTDPNEQCDDGNNDNSDACINCYDAVCGDAFVQTGVEACDDGNLIETDACLSGCVAATCGDGFVQAGVEECDDGNTVGGDGCPASCFFYQQTPLTPFNYTEIANGTALTFAGGGNNPNDDGIVQVTLPFGFSYFGGTATTTVTVSPNGLIAFGPLTPSETFNNTNIPDGASPNGIVAGWWEDLLIDTQIPGGAEVSWTVQGSAPNRVAIFQWRDVRVANQTTFNHRRFNFQIQVQEDGVIRLAYGDTETRNQVRTQTSASAGLEGPNGSNGYEALGCSPGCDGPARSAQRPDGFPEQSSVTFTP